MFFSILSQGQGEFDRRAESNDASLFDDD